MFKAALVAVCAIITSSALGAEVKLTVLYGHPKSPADFDKYYAEKHMPMVYAAAGAALKRTEIAKPLAPPTGGQPAYYVITELWFDSLDDFKAVVAKPEWKAVPADLDNFASGGATIFLSKVETRR